MAIRYRKDRKAPWQVYWNNPHSGRRESRSFEHEHDARKFDSLVKHRLRYEPETFESTEAPVDDPAGLTLEALIYAYLKAKAMTPTNLKMTLYHVRSILGDIGPVLVADLSKDMLRLAVQRQKDRNVKPNTVNRRISIIKSALNWAEDEGMIPANPVPRFSCPRGPDLIIPPPTPSEVEAILAVAPDRILREVVLGVSMGMRIGPSELYGMRWADFDFGRRVVRVGTAKRKQQGKYRDLHLIDSLLPTLQAWWEADMPQGIETVIHFRGRPVQSLKKAWKSTLEAAGITRRIRQYDLRHAFATYALDRGADPKAIAEIMGHTDMAMIHRHYQHVLNRQRQAAMEAAPVPETLGHISGHMDHDNSEAFWAHFDVSSDRKGQGLRHITLRAQRSGR